MHAHRLALLLVPASAVVAVLAPTVTVLATGYAGTHQAARLVPPAALETAQEPRLPHRPAPAPPPNQAAHPRTAPVPPRVLVHATPHVRTGTAVTAVTPAATPVTTPTTPTGVTRYTAQSTAAPVAQRTVTPPAPRPVTAPAPAPAPEPVRPQPSGGDDYPYRDATTNSIDRWGFNERQCTSFVAWRLALHGRILDNGAQGWGSALTWDDAARRLGVAVSTTPSVGAVAQWGAGESSAYYSPGSSSADGRFTASGYGHVAWVRSVYADGSVLVEQYNLGEGRSYSVMHVKAPRFLRLG